RIEITTRRAVQDTLAGGYHSVFKGRGMAFSEVRPYQPGDEIRSIDWNVTARMGEPFVKVFAEERELTALIAVDRSASQDAGLGHHSSAQRRSAVVLVVSDFLADAYGQRLAVLARRHDVIPMVLTDPVEKKLPDVGGLWPIADAETGETVLVDLSDEGTRRAWEARAADRVQKRERTFRRLSLEAVRVRPGDDYVAPLAALF